MESLLILFGVIGLFFFLMRRGGGGMGCCGGTHSHTGPSEDGKDKPEEGQTKEVASGKKGAACH